MSEPSPTEPMQHWAEAMIRRIEAESARIDSLETRVVPLLERIASALEVANHDRSTDSGTGHSSPVSAFAQFREALKQADWEQASFLLATFPLNDPATIHCSHLLEQARATAAEDLRQKLQAAQAVHDAETTLEIRDQLAAALGSTSMRDVDQPIVKWLMSQIQRRLRGGTIRPDVVQLAETVSLKFAGWNEGASLRAALPTLRRSAGLCPECGEPHLGEEDTCVKCRAAAELLVPNSFESGPIFDEDLDHPDVEPLDLNNERNWESP